MYLFFSVLCFFSSVSVFWEVLLLLLMLMILACLIHVARPCGTHVLRMSQLCRTRAVRAYTAYFTMCAVWNTSSDYEIW